MKLESQIKKILIDTVDGQILSNEIDSLLPDVVKDMSDQMSVLLSSGMDIGRSVTCLNYATFRSLLNINAGIFKLTGCNNKESVKIAWDSLETIFSSIFEQQKCDKTKKK